MNYHHITENVIGCYDFLPNKKVDDIYTDILNNRSKFNVPNWGSEKNENVSELYSSKCGGLDYWIGWREKVENNKNIQSLNEWFLHQGLLRFTRDKGVFELLQRNLDGDMHIISYNNGGYYNWHYDKMAGNIFTFNLVLHRGDSLQGGDMLFMDNDRIVRVENKNNLMVLFPSYVPHSITPLYSNDSKNVPFMEQRFSIQTWLRLT